MKESTATKLGWLFTLVLVFELTIYPDVSMSFGAKLTTSSITVLLAQGFMLWPFIKNIKNNKK